MPETRRLFRVVKTIPPTLRDFLPQIVTQPKRKPAVDATPEELRLHLAVSYRTTLGAARNLAREMPGLGAHIAELALPADAPITAREGRGGHVDVWGDPAVLLSFVVNTFPV